MSTRTPKAKAPVSAAGVRRLFDDDEFLDQLVDLCPLEDLDEPFDRSDAWWWIAGSFERMKRYKRRDLRATSREWIKRLRVNEVLRVREEADAGKYDHLLPKEIHDARRD